MVLSTESLGTWCWGASTVLVHLYVQHDRYIVGAISPTMTHRPHQDHRLPTMIVLHRFQPIHPSINPVRPHRKSYRDVGTQSNPTPSPYHGHHVPVTVPSKLRMYTTPYPIDSIRVLNLLHSVHWTEHGRIRKD